MSKSIHTIDSRENLELLTVAAFFGIQSDAMHSLISDWHDLLEAELQSEGIDYRELKAALVPAKKKREAALIFDTAAKSAPLLSKVVANRCRRSYIRVG